ncbi:unnamed protein product, partial [Ectocarpus sp. 13 AM-2016]
GTGSIKTRLPEACGAKQRNRRQGGARVVQGVRLGTNNAWIRNTIRQQQHPPNGHGWGDNRCGWHLGSKNLAVRILSLPYAKRR